MQVDTRFKRSALLERLARMMRGDRATPVEPPDTAPMVARLTRPWADTRPILLASADAGAPCPVTDWLRAAGHQVIPAEGFGLAIGEMLAHRRFFSMLILDIDGFGGPELVVARLMDLRRRHPSLPVIVISAEVQFNDFTAERLTICDVTLRAPVSAPALELALAEAAVNNLLWQARQTRARRGPSAPV